MEPADRLRRSGSTDGGSPHAVIKRAGDTTCYQMFVQFFGRATDDLPNVLRSTYGPRDVLPHAVTRAYRGAATGTGVRRPTPGLGD
jgi:hypothetical protein